MAVDPHNPEIVARVPSDIEAAAIVTALSAHGIKASTAGGYIAGFRAEAPSNVQVIVRHEDLAAAKKVLANLEQEPSSVDWSQVDVGEPEDS